MDAMVVVPLVLALLAGGGFVLNEWSHGAMSETMGLEHRHLSDDGGWHCGEGRARANATCAHPGAAHAPMHGGMHGA